MPTSTTTKLIRLFLIGAVIFLVNTLITPHILNAITNWPTKLQDTVSDGESALALISNIFMLGSLLAFFTKEIFSSVWENLIELTINPFTNTTKEHLKEISSEISTIRKETETLSTTFQTFLVENKKPLSMETCKSKKDFDKLMLPPCKELFGKHIDRPESMFTYVRKVYLDAFSEAPHPSSVSKTIKLRNHETFTNYVEWHEETIYKIHHVSYPRTNKTGKYLLRFKGTSFAPDLEKEKWAESLQLKLRVDGETLLSPSSLPIFVDEDTNEEGFFCRKVDNWVHLWFQKEIDLNKEWTDIVSEETSINSKLDRVYTLHTNKPTCKYTLDATLPNDLSFIKHPFTSPKIIYSGLPEHIKKDLPKGTTIKHDTHNHIRVAIEEWVMPGIVVNLNWIDNTADI